MENKFSKTFLRTKKVITMALFAKSNIPIEEVKQLRSQGLSDNQIIDELNGGGYALPQINDALAQAAIASPEIEPEVMGPGVEEMGPPPALPGGAPQGLGEDMYGRIEEIAESIIDEKWDLLVEEVKKIVEWKEKVDGELSGLKNAVGSLKEDFKELHQGVLGKLETYDERMMEVGTELKAVGKVFKDVVPEFVENVKELKSVTGKMGKGKKK